MPSGIPEKITIDGKEIVVKDNPELLRLMEAARTEEKDKLYSNISTLEAAKKVLEDEKKTNGQLSVAKEAELKKTKDDLAVAKADAEAKKLEVEKLKKMKDAAGKKKNRSEDDDDEDDDDEDDEEDKKKKGKNKGQSQPQGVTLEQIEALMAKRDKQLEEKFDAKVGGVSKDLSKTKVAEYRKEQLKKYKDVIASDLTDDLVPESLDTEEAVNKAIEKAILKSKPYVRKEYEVAPGKKQMLSLAEIEAAEAKKKEDSKSGGSGGRETEDDDDDKDTGGDGHYKGTKTFTGRKAPKRPDQGGGDISGKELLSKVDEMSDAEYERNRDKILREAKQVKYEGVPED